jgi:hypothetical protein
MGAVTQHGVRVEGCLNQLGERITSLQGVTYGLQAQLSRLSLGQPSVALMELKQQQRHKYSPYA